MSRMSAVGVFAAFVFISVSVVAAVVGIIAGLVAAPFLAIYRAAGGRPARRRPSYY